MTSWVKLQDNLKTLQEESSSIQDVQCQLLAIVIEMGKNLDPLLNTKQPASSPTAEDRVVDSVSSRTSAKGLSPLWEKDEEDEDWVGKGMLDLGQKTTLVKALPSRTFGGPLVNEGHCDISLPKVTSLRTLGQPSTSGETDTSKRASKVPLG